MFPHPEDLHRLHQQQHAELIRHHTLVRQARAANPPTHRLREIGLQISTFVLSGRWWKGITGAVHPPQPPGPNLHNRGAQRRAAGHHTVPVPARLTRECSR